MALTIEQRIENLRDMHRKYIAAGRPGAAQRTLERIKELEVLQKEGRHDER